MANTIISPNMTLPVPVVSQDPGPDWANNINASLGIIDSHNHSAGQGVQVTPNGLNINSDLSIGTNNLTNVRATRYTSLSGVLTTGADIGETYVVGSDLYYNDLSGNNVRITQGGNVVGSSGTITGLPSGTASASFSGVTFTFQSATNTPAAMSVGPLTIAQNTVGSNTITFAVNSAISGNYTLTFPAAAPAANQVLLSDGSGNFSWASIGNTISSGSIGTGINVGNSTTLGSITLGAGNWMIISNATYNASGGIPYFLSYIGTIINSHTGTTFGLDKGIGLIAANGVGSTITLYKFVSIAVNTTFYLTCETGTLVAAGNGGILGSIVGFRQY